MIYSILNTLNLSKKFPYFIFTPLPYAIGTAGDQFIAVIKKAQFLKKKVIIIAPTIFPKLLKYKVCNKCFFQNTLINGFNLNKLGYWKYLLIFLINIQFFFNRCLVLFLDSFSNIKAKESFRFPHVGVEDSFDKKFFDLNNLKKEKFENIKPLPVNYSDICVSLEPHLIEICEKKLLQVGLDSKSKFVCLHVRDSKFRNDPKRRNFRNSDIKNYEETIKYLLNNGYYVFRMGRIADKKVDINHEKFIDYPFSNLNSEMMDLYLIKNCYFFIGNAAGITSLSFVYNKPTLLTNYVKVFEGKGTNHLNRSVYKKPFWKKNGKLLSFREYINLTYNYHHINFINDEIDFKENISKEILVSTKEFCQLLEKKIDCNLTDSQKKFNQLLLSSMEEKFYYNNLPKGQNFSQSDDCVRFIREMKEEKGSASLSFLEENL